MTSGGSAEHIVLKRSDRLNVEMVFIGIDQEIGLKENLPIDADYIFIGVVVGNEEAHAFHLLFSISAQFVEHSPSLIGPQFLLVLARAITIFPFTGVNANVVEYRRRFQDEQSSLVDLFQLSDGHGKVVYLHEMLYARHIPSVILRHPADQFCMLLFHLYLFYGHKLYSIRKTFPNAKFKKIVETCKPFSKISSPYSNV